MRKILFLLGQMSDEDVRWIGRAATAATFGDRETLIQEGVQSDAVFIISHGKARVTASFRGDIAVIGAGEILGELSFLDKRPPLASVIAVGKCDVLRIEKAALERKLSADPSFSANFYRGLAVYLADRLRDTVYSLGYNKPASAGLTDETQEGELDEGSLETLSRAGDQFHMLMREAGLRG